MNSLVEKDITVKTWLIEATDSGKTRKTLIKAYRSGDSSDATPSDYYTYKGIVYEHMGHTSSYKSYGGDFAAEENFIGYRTYDHTDISHLEGELLTLIDAMLTDKTQRDAFKSILRRTLWKYNSDKSEEVAEMCKVAKIKEAE